MTYRRRFPKSKVGKALIRLKQLVLNPKNCFLNVTNRSEILIFDFSTSKFNIYQYDQRNYELKTLEIFNKYILCD